MNEVLVGVGVLPHRTPMTPKDLLAVHLHWKGSLTAECQDWLTWECKVDKPIDLWYVGGNILLLLSTVLAGEVLQSVVSVGPSVLINSIYSSS